MLCDCSSVVMFLIPTSAAMYAPAINNKSLQLLLPLMVVVVVVVVNWYSSIPPGSAGAIMTFSNCPTRWFVVFSTRVVKKLSPPKTTRRGYLRIHPTTTTRLQIPQFLPKRSRRHRWLSQCILHPGGKVTVMDRSKTTSTVLNAPNRRG